MLEANDISAMRETMESALPDTCTIVRITRTSDGAGGSTETETTIAADLACRVSPGGQIERDAAIANQLNPTSTWRITVPYNTDVTAADRITIAGNTYEVFGVRKRRAWALSSIVMAILHTTQD